MSPPSAGENLERDQRSESQLTRLINATPSIEGFPMRFPCFGQRRPFPLRQRNLRLQDGCRMPARPALAVAAQQQPPPNTAVLPGIHKRTCDLRIQLPLPSAALTSTGTHPPTRRDVQSRLNCGNRASVDNVVDAADERCPIGGEERYQLRNLLRPARSAEWNSSDHVYDPLTSRLLADAGTS